MSHLTYYAYEGAGVYNRKAYHYNQAVRIPASADRVELAGQGTTSISQTSHTIERSQLTLYQAAGTLKPAK
jgi:hypothetical protein